MKKKIIHCLYNLKQGGAEQMVIDLCNSQSKLDKVVLLTFWDKEEDPANTLKNRLNSNVDLVDLNVLQSRKIKTMFHLFSYIKINKPNVVHVHMGRMAFYLILPLFFLPKIKFVQTCHTDPEFEAEGLIERIFRTILYKLDLIKPVVLSSEFQLSFAKYFHKVTPLCVTNGRSFREKSCLFESVNNEVNRLRKTSATKIFIHVARYSKEKNQMMLIDSFLSIRNKGFDVVLMILGSGFDEIKDEIAQKDVDQCVCFLGMKDNVHDYLYCSDAFCLSSNYEGVPLSLIEAMSVGCIPIVTPVGAISEMLLNGKLGYISSSIAQRDYEEAIVQFLNNNMIKKSDLQDRFNDFYTIERMVDNYYSIYNK